MARSNAGTPTPAIFPKSSAGKNLTKVFIVSSVISTISVGLNLTIFGFSSFFVTPAAFVVTIIHHITIRCLLAKKSAGPGSGGILIDSPAESRFECLRHSANFWILPIFASTWLVGGILTILVELYNGYVDCGVIIRYLDIVSGCLAVAESGVLIIMAAFCRMLRNEANSQLSNLQCSEVVSVESLDLKVDTSGSYWQEHSG
ncbi:hypothetical protein CTheo_8329 [Ceratobasidium theobromae]|uniref:Transmembrane protein n=1 Tax=Ceratobasidium theobromae TaxID=1582974 RepID=A0A5N5Q9Z3_9AGAM|nr:hypothetical protein CTheo_8329 [Ceratobasidium theobromae]